MDHHDWPDWGADEPDPGDADTADLDRPDEPVGGFEDFGAHSGDEAGDLDSDGYDTAGDLDSDLGHDTAGVADDSSAEPPAALDGYLEDDPFGHAVYGDGDPGGDPAADDGTGPDVAHADDGAEPVLTDPVVGTDPDLDPHAGGDWPDHEFPPQLDLAHAPEPVDGYPWSDPAALGASVADDDGVLEAGWSQPTSGELLDYAGMSPGGVDPWQALLGSDDPATSALARWWLPGT